MKKPILLLSPEESNIASGTLFDTSPYLEGDATSTLVAGRFGQAWRINVPSFLTGEAGFGFTNLPTTGAFSLLVRFKTSADDNWQISFETWNEVSTRGNLSINGPQGGSSLHSGFSNNVNWQYHDRNWDTVGTTSLLTLAIRVTSVSFAAYENGNRVTVWESDGTEAVNFPGLLQPDWVSFSKQIDLESILVFNDYLSDDDIQQISNMQERWTWENTTLAIPDVKPKGTSASFSIQSSLYKVTKNNEFIEDLTPYVRKGRVTFNPDRAIKWDFEAEISTDANIAPFKDYIAPHIRLEYEDGHVEEAQFGIYNTVPPKQSISQTQRTVTIDSRDLTWQLSNSIFENGYSRNAGFNIVETVRSLIEGAGFTRHSIPSFATTFPNTVSWKAGTSRLEVINDMLNMISYYTLFMDRTGYLVSLPYVTDKDKAVSVTYDTTDRFSVVKVLRTIQHDTTPDRIANRIVVIGGGSTEEPIVATAINNSPNSPTSTVNLGMTITKKYEGAQIADQAAADIMAKRNLDIASQEYHKLTLNTTPDLSVEPYDVYRLNILDAFGETAASGVWNSRGFSVGFTPNDAIMTHDLSNIDDPPMEV